MRLVDRGAAAGRRGAVPAVVLEAGAPAIHVC